MDTEVTVSDVRDAIERYEIESRIDEEGQKFVFAGQSADSPVAVKVIAVESAEATDYAEHVMDPVVDVTADSLVDTRDVFVVPDGDRWLLVKVEAFVPGQTLRELLDERAPSLGLGVLVTQRLLKATDALATARTPHYDVKPRNVRVTPDGHLFLVDVSVVRRLEAKGFTHKSGAGAVGPMSYSAPEQRDQPLSSWDARVDLFSIGVTAIEVAGGGLSPDDPESVSLPSRSSSEFPSLDAARDGVDVEAFESVLARLTATDPDDRFDGPSDALAALERTLSEDAVRHLEATTVPQ